MNFTQLFKTKKEVLDIRWSNPLQNKKVASHKILKVNNNLYYRKDEVERLMQEIIDLKIRNGELAVIKTIKSPQNV